VKEKVKIVTYDPGVTRIGVIADTHLPTRARYIPSRVFEIFAGVQLILHAGDLVDDSVVAELSAVAPVEAVAGNMDPLLLGRKLGRIKLIRIGCLAIGLLHGDLNGRLVNFSLVKDLFLPNQPAAIVFGHLHEPVAKRVGEILFFNPGSAVDPRRVRRPSCGLLTISGPEVHGDIIYI